MKEYEEYNKDVRKKLIKGLKDLSNLADKNEIPLDYCAEKLYELLSYVEDLIEAFKEEKNNILNRSDATMDEILTKQQKHLFSELRKTF